MIERANEQNLSDSYAYKQGARAVLEWLSEIYEDVQDTDAWAEFFVDEEQKFGCEDCGENSRRYAYLGKSKWSCESCYESGVEQ